MVFAPTRVWLAPQFFTFSTFSHESMYGATKFAAACQTPTAWRRCQSRLQFRFQTPAEGFRKGMNPHYSSCFQLCAVICERPPKVSGRVANRYYNSYFTYIQKTWLTGLAAVRIDTTVLVFSWKDAVLAWADAEGSSRGGRRPCSLRMK